MNQAIVWYGSIIRLMRRKDGAASSLQTAVVSVLIIAVNMATGIVCARYLGPDGRGDQFAMILWQGFLASMLTIGLPSSLLYQTKKSPQDASELYRTSLVLCMLLGITATAIGWLGIPFWMGGYKPEVIHFAQWTMLLSPLTLVHLVNQSALQARGDFVAYNRLRYMPQIVTLLVLVLLVLTHQLNVFGSSLAYMLPVFPLTIWAGIRMLRKDSAAVRTGFSIKKATTASRLLRYGIGAYGIDVMVTLSMYLDQVIVVGLLSSSELGLYIVALSLARMTGIIQTSIANILFPKASGLPREEALALTARVFRISLWFTLLATASAGVVAPYALKLLYGPLYEGGMDVFRIVLVEVVLGGSAMVLSQAFMALGHPGKVSVLQLLGQGLTVPLLFLLVPSLGLTGAGLALVASGAVKFLFMLIQFPRTFHIPFPSIWLRRDDVLWVRDTLMKREPTMLR